MTDSPTTLFDALPRNVIELAKEADLAVKAGNRTNFAQSFAKSDCRVALPWRIFIRPNGLEKP